MQNKNVLKSTNYKKTVNVKKNLKIFKYSIQIQ